MKKNSEAYLRANPDDPGFIININGLNNSIAYFGSNQCDRELLKLTERYCVVYQTLVTATGVKAKIGIKE
jgi:hypothetical protein